MLDIIIAVAVAIIVIYVLVTVYKNARTAAKEQKTYEYYKYNAIKQIMAQVHGELEFQMSAHAQNEFFTEPYKIENLEMVLQEVLEHCGYRGRIPTVRYTLLGNENSKHTLNDNRYFLTIGTDKHPTADVILALLIHECMHVYLYDNRMKFVGISEECATYMLAIHLGFYQQIMKGIPQIGHLKKNEVEELYKIFSLNQ